MEVWKAIEGTDGRYEVSNTGKVRGMNYRNQREPKEISQREDKYGYKRVNIFCNGKRAVKTVHRLVAEAFIPNPDALPQVNHIDGNKKNNEKSNLEWCTASRNVQHAFDIGLKEKSREHARIIGINHNLKTSKKVVVTNTESGKRMVFNSISEACRILGVTRSNAQQVLNSDGKRKIAGGYYWELIEER